MTQGVRTEALSVGTVDRPSEAERPVPKAPRSLPDLAGSPRISALLIGLVLLPLLVSAVVLVVDIGGDYNPTADHALTELRTRDVGRHPVLLGLSSRENWTHPGPALFYLLSVPYRLSGSSSIGLALGALLINGLAIAGIAVLARRRGGTPLFLCALVGSAILMRSLGADFLQDFWNPFVPALALGLVVFLVWAMTCGERWALPVAVGVGSFVVQVHVGYLPLVVPLLLWGTAWLCVLARRTSGKPEDGSGRSTHGLVRAGVVAVAVLAVMWLPAIVEELQSGEGNISTMVDYFRTTDEKASNLGDGYRVVAGQLDAVPEWLTGAPKPTHPFVEPDALRSSTVPVLLLPFGLAAVMFWRRRSWQGLRLVATITVLMLLGTVTVATTVGGVLDYRLRWSWVLGMMVALVSVWGGWLFLARRFSQAEARVLVPLSVLALAILTVWNTTSAARLEAAPAHRAGWSSKTESVVPSVLAALPDDAVVVVRSPEWLSAPFAVGVMLQLERHGIEALAPKSRRIFGEHRVRSGGPVDAILTVASDAAVDDVFVQRDQQLIAYSGPDSRQALERRVRRKAMLDTAHENGEISDEDWYLERVALNSRRAIAVFAER
jgi:hypothetical protein